MWVKWVLLTLSILPLSVLHALGVCGGRLVYRFDKRYRARLQANAAQAGFERPDFWSESAAHMGRSVFELAHLWTYRVNRILPKIKVTGWEEVLAAQAKGHGILMISPHIGAFELTSLWIGQRMPFTAMYRPPKQALIADAMLTGRQKFNIKMASADVKGIRSLLRALKSGEIIGILPDQVPNSSAEAVVAPVFGAPALTMTLPAKLIKQTGAALVTVYTKRVSAKHRYEIEFKIAEFHVTGDAVLDATRINALLEDIILTAPSQYLWGYNRYKNVGKMLGNT